MCKDNKDSWIGWWGFDQISYVRTTIGWQMICHVILWIQ